MKSAFAFTFFLLLPFFACADAPQWFTDYPQALQIAKKENKPLVLFFTGSDWCRFCKLLEKNIFDTSAFQQAVGDSLLFVTVDFPRKPLAKEQKKANDTLLKQYSVGGFPTLVVLSPTGKELGRTGYLPIDGKKYGEDLLKLAGISKK